jgi:hypothetical protein
VRLSWTHRQDDGVSFDRSAEHDLGSVLLSHSQPPECRTDVGPLGRDCRFSSGLVVIGEPHDMFDHQVGRLLAVDQDDSLAKPLHMAGALAIARSVGRFIPSVSARWKASVPSCSRTAASLS